ncbi:MAG: hypothetical protein JWM41_58 [Gemmatimonadetes bacterium]|nr:hypothetical protein [Gemmatimonadota bacterium]
MMDRAHPPFHVTSTRIGRTDLGQGTAVIDDDAIVVVVRAAADERPVRVPLSAIDGITVEGNELTLSLRDGMRLVLGAEAVTELRDELVAHCRAIPELTRALRAFGSRRGHRSDRSTGPGEQQRFFAPLLEARRQAVNATTPDAAMAAFDPPSLDRAIVAALQAFATERYGENAPARRALEAELVDLAEPLQNALEALHRAAEDVGSDTDDLRLWRTWSAQLRATFETADRVWLSLDAALDATPWHA